MNVALWYGAKYKVYFDILNLLGVTHECDRQTSRHSRHKCRDSLRCAAKKVNVFDSVVGDLS